MRTRRDFLTTLGAGTPGAPGGQTAGSPGPTGPGSAGSNSVQMSWRSSARSQTTSRTVADRRRPAGRLRRPRRSRLSWMGDPRARCRARPGRLGQRVHAHEQALHRAGAQARPVKARSPMAHSSFPFRAGGAGLLSLVAAARRRRARRRRARRCRRQAARGRRGAAARDAVAPGRPGAHRRPRRRQAVHVLHLAGHAEEADALPDPQRRRRRLTRGFPPAAGERADHPHHVGLWFNYGDVNGYDFWNHSSAIVDPARLEKMGRIVHARRHADGQRPRPRRAAGCGRAGSRPRTARRWSTRTPRSPSAPPPTGCASSIARPTCGPPARTSRSPTTRKGMLGLRVRRALEDPAEKGGEFVDAAGKVTKTAALDSDGRDRRLYQQRGQDGRQGLGHARQVDDARRARSTGAPSPSPSSTIRATRATRPTGTRAATACSPPTRSARRCSARARRS